MCGTTELRRVIFGSLARFPFSQRTQAYTQSSLTTRHTAISRIYAPSYTRQRTKTQRQKLEIKIKIIKEEKESCDQERKKIISKRSEGVRQVGGTSSSFHGAEVEGHVRGAAGAEMESI